MKNVLKLILVSIVVAAIGTTTALSQTNNIPGNPVVISGKLGIGYQPLVFPLRTNTCSAGSDDERQFTKTQRNRQALNTSSPLRF